MPKVHARALPPFENQDRDLGARIIEIYLVLFIDCRIACFGKFAGAEEQVANKRWDNVDVPSGGAYLMEPCDDGGCWGYSAIR